LAGFAAGLFVLFVAEVVLGGLLEFRYSPTPEAAYRDVHAIQMGGLAMLRAFHYWSSSILIAGTFLTILWMLSARWFNSGRNRIWIATWILFLASLLSQITGNLLPFDRHGVQTAVIESGVARRMPVLGGAASSMMLGGERFSGETLRIWHLGHIAFPILGLFAAWLFWAASRKEAKSPAFVWVPLGIAALAMLMLPAPLGAAASQADYGAFDAQVSWYTWPLHGAFNLFGRLSPDLGWIGSGLVPALFVGFGLGAPWIAQKVSGKAIQMIVLGFCGFFLLAAVFFGGRPAPLTGARDPGNGGVVTGPIGPADKVLFAEGRDLFASKGCAGCHGKDGVGGPGAPNLVRISSRRGSNPQWYMRFIHNPQSVKPNSTMPPFSHLKEDETRAIAEFLIHHE
jgi:ubiquinol-cytochrome c reductase cytochrome b subunit